MAYHNTNYSVPSNARQSTTNDQGQTAPAGFHYMPDGTLMSDAEHALLYGNQSTKYYNPYEKDPISDRVANKVIKSFDLDFKDIKAAGESRRFIISGDNGATFSLEIKNEDNYYYNFQTQSFQVAKTGLINEVISGSAYNRTIKFPVVTDADQYDFYLFAIDTEDTKHSEYVEVRFDDGSLDINSSRGSNSNLMKKVIYQTLDVTITLASYSPNNTVTGTIGTQTITASRNKGASKIPISFIFTATSTRTLSINRKPTANDIMAFVTPTIGSEPIDIPGEDIYPTATTAFTGDDINGAVTSGAVVRMDNTDLSAVIKVGDKITTPVTTDTVNGDFESGAEAITMDSAVATKMAVGDQVTGNAQLDAGIYTVASLDSTNVFSLNEAAQIADGTTLTFSSKINRSTTTVTVVETGSVATDFTMSQDIQFRDNAPLTFYSRRNYRWPVDNIYGLQSGMRVHAGSAGGFSGIVTIKEYLDKITIFEGEANEERITKEKVASLDALDVKPVITRNASTKVATTVQTGNIVFNEQATYDLRGVTIKVFSYGPSEINRLTGYDLEFSDLAVALTEVTTTTTASTIGAPSTTVAVANRAGIMDSISSVSGIGINPAVANPTVAAGAGSVTGAGTIVLSAAQELESGITLTFPGAGTIATITGYVKVNNAGNEDVTLRFDLEKRFTMH